MSKSTVFLCLGVLAWSANAHGVPIQELRITDVEGPVAVVPKGSTQASPAKKGFPLDAGDRLITGEKGRLELASKEGTVIRLHEKSYFRLQKIYRGETVFFLKVGSFWGHFAPKKETGIAYRVGTPLILAGVRGTDLGISVNENGETEGGVVEGVVDFKKPAHGPSATINWSDEDPRWTEAESEAKPGVVAESSQGVTIKPNEAPEKSDSIPSSLVPSLAWFESVRERVPKLRDEWKDLDEPSKMKLRQKALRERINWEIPAKLTVSAPSVPRVSPRKHNLSNMR